MPRLIRRGELEGLLRAAGLGQGRGDGVVHQRPEHLHLAEEQVRVGEGVRHQHLGAGLRRPRVEVRAGGARQVAGGAPGRRGRGGPGAADAQQVAAGAGGGGHLVAEGVVLRPVAVDQPEVEHVARGHGVAGREVEVVHHELREVGDAGGDVGLGAGAPGAADLLGDLRRARRGRRRSRVARPRRRARRSAGVPKRLRAGASAVEGQWHVGARSGCVCSVRSTKHPHPLHERDSAAPAAASLRRTPSIPPASGRRRRFRAAAGIAFRHPAGICRELGTGVLRRKRMGIRQLANELQLSIGTVSRALNDRPDVNPETRAGSRRRRRAPATCRTSPGAACAAAAPAWSPR